MRLKPVPEPPADLGRLAAARRAVPLVPGSTDDCCARLRRRLELRSRDEARTWLTFLRALELVEETTRGYARVRLGGGGGSAAGNGTGTGTGTGADDGGGSGADGVGDLPDRNALGTAFRRNVFGAREVLETLAAAEASPVDPGDAFERVAPSIPRWERHRDPTWRETWRDRTRRLLEWAVLFGLADRADGGYGPARG